MKKYYKKACIFSLCTKVTYIEMKEKIASLQNKQQDFAREKQLLFWVPIFLIKSKTKKKRFQIHLLCMFYQKKREICTKISSVFLPKKAPYKIRAKPEYIHFLIWCYFRFIQLESLCISPESYFVLLIIQCSGIFT